MSAVVAAIAFDAEWRLHAHARVSAIEAEVLAREIEDLERRAGRRVAAVRWARLLGLPATLAPVLGVALYSASREGRLRAASLIAHVLTDEPS